MLAPSLFPSQSSQTTHIDFHKYASQRERERMRVCVCACECWSKNGNRLLTLALAKATQSTRRSRKVGAFTSIAQHKQVIYKSTKKGQWIHKFITAKRSLVQSLICHEQGGGRPGRRGGCCLSSELSLPRQLLLVGGRLAAQQVRWHSMHGAAHVRGQRSGSRENNPILASWQRKWCSDVPTRLANKFIFNFVLEKSGIINIENKRTNLLPLSLTLPVQLHRHY